MQTNDACWHAVQQRDANSANAFVYGVRSTGIYCRPGCPSRLPRRDNTSYYPTWRQAEAAGLRPCRRCHPRGQTPAADLIATLCRAMDAAETPPTLTALATKAGYSKFHLQRLFKAQTGVTPRQYAAASRANRVRAQLAAGIDVTQALYGAGYNAPSRFYADAPATLGMAPATARRGGQGERIAYATAPVSLGILLAATTARGLCAVSLGDTPADLIAALHTRFPAATLTAQPGLDGLLTQLCAAIEGDGTATHLPLDLRGTLFQQKVWRALQTIPLGHTETYAGLAARIGSPTAARAVAAACAANPLAVVIPCHRVVRGTGALAGYRWGLDRKQALLAQEATQRPNVGPSTGAPIGPVSRKSRASGIAASTSSNPPDRST